MIVTFIALGVISAGTAFAFAIYRTGKVQQASAYATQCSVATTKAENYVAIWKLYGTPTPTLTLTPRSTYGAIPATATATYLAARDATPAPTTAYALVPSALAASLDFDLPLPVLSSGFWLAFSKPSDMH